MTRPAPIRLSASAVRDFNECPYRYAKTYLSPLPDHEKEPVSILAFGDIVHRVLAEFIRRGGWKALSKNDLFAILRSHWRRNIYTDDDLSLVNFERAADMLERFFDFPYPRVVERELGVERRIGWNRSYKGILAVGRLDRACELPGGAIEIIDYKTGRCRLSEEQILMEPQALFMRSLAAVAYKEFKATAFTVSFLYLHSGVPVRANFDIDDFSRGWKHIEEVASKIRQGMREVIAGSPVNMSFPPNRGERCRSCPIRRHCDKFLSSAHTPIPR